MELLSILLQEPTLPTNIYTVGGLLTVFAGVIAYLFKLYDSSQEKRFLESKNNLENQITQLRKEVDGEKLESKELRNRFDAFTQNDHQQMMKALQDNNALLTKVGSKYL